MAEGALQDVVVLELGRGVASGYCGKLLADLGAQVVKVEGPGGDSMRLEEPLVGGESVFFNWLNRNKLGVEMGLEDARLDGLIRQADIVVHSERGEAAERLAERVTALNGRAISLSLTPYGLSGTRTGWEASALTEWATGGYHYFGGDPAREPVALPGFQAEFHGGLQGALGALAGLWEARETSKGQRVEVSHQEAVMNAHAWLTTIWTHQGTVQRRTGASFVPCADGFVYVFHLTPYPNIFVMIERFDLLEDESLQIPAVWWERFDEVMEALGEWTKTRTKREVYHTAQELRIALSPLNTMSDLAEHRQLLERAWFTEVEAGGRTFTAPGFPVHPEATPCSVRRPAPKLGEHTAEVLGDGFAWANAGVKAGNRARVEGEGPLAGLRVIEMTAHWAGPIGGRHLADLGADVIKVELAKKPATRSLVPVGDDIWPEHYHRAGYFNKLNRNKRAICLDVSKPEGREVLLKLVAQSDVLLENNAARVMKQLGVGYDTLSQVNPGLVMCSMSGYGATGPERDYSAFGSNIETASGLATLMGYGPGEYYSTGSFYADPVTGTHSAVAVMAALNNRRRTGKGQWIDVSLLEAVLPFFSQQFLHYTVTGELPEPIGNRSRVHAPQGVYRSAGTDCWLAVTVRNERDWRGLCEVIGREDLRDDPGLATAEGRQKRHDEIDAAITAWSETRDHLRGSEVLQARGVPAAPVLANYELVSDNHLHERGFFVPVRHEHAGTHLFPGFTWKFAETPTRVRMAAPLFAEHNAEVFAGLLGMDDAAIAALYAKGITSDEPVYAAAGAL